MFVRERETKRKRKIQYISNIYVLEARWSLVLYDAREKNEQCSNDRVKRFR